MRLLERAPVPVFPLPNVVLFPRVVLPLYVFEPRYREMLSDVLDSYGRIAMALLKPGWEPHYHGYPDVYPTVAVGKVVTYRTREDGTSDVILLGECRAQILEWAEISSYRKARLVELVESAPRAAFVDPLRRRLRHALSLLVARKQMPGELERLQQLFARENDVGFLVDFLAYHFLDDTNEKRTLLEELDVERRADLLFKFLLQNGIDVPPPEAGR